MAPELMLVITATVFCVSVKSAPGAMLAMTGLVMTAPEPMTPVPLVVKLAPLPITMAAVVLVLLVKAEKAEDPPPFSCVHPPVVTEVQAGAAVPLAALHQY